jgi:hypothetical protein
MVTKVVLVVIAVAVLVYSAIPLVPQETPGSCCPVDGSCPTGYVCAQAADPCSSTDPWYCVRIPEPDGDDLR